MKEITLLSFPRTDAYNGGSSVKVPAIKALRRFSGIGLKEAKDIIEELQEGHIQKVSLVEGDLETEALKDFHRLGGIYTSDDKLLTLLEDALKVAVAQKQYGVVTHVSAALNLIF